MAHNIQAIATQFQIEGQFIEAYPYGSGHINDTYAAVYQKQHHTKRYIHQRINHKVFKNPLGVMDNIQRVTHHVAQKLAVQEATTPPHQTLTLVPTRQDKLYHQDEDGNFWRTYIFIEGAQTYDAVTRPEQAYQVGKAFGYFQKLLIDLPSPRLLETIPDFHHTPKRLASFTSALEADVHNRAKNAQSEINFALQQKYLANVLIDFQAADKIPERITHNDTKLNNVMLDNATGKEICVVDLDTVMPSLALYDFGDMVRTSTCLTVEDEQDLSKVKMEMPYFEALTRGYLDQAGDFLNETEKSLLVLSGKLITFEIGIRFLTDYLEGDTYFKTHRPDHNLDRCRSQFKLVQSISEQEAAMTHFVETVINEQLSGTSERLTEY